MTKMGKIVPVDPEVLESISEAGGLAKKTRTSRKRIVATLETHLGTKNMDLTEMVDNAMLREEYDQYNEDPNFNNKQREYYNQRYNIQYMAWQLIRKVPKQSSFIVMVSNLLFNLPT